jgi:predicted acylesterase/phospholipase RssA
MSLFSSERVPKYVVFSGGGQRGLAYAGAITALSDVYNINLAHGLHGAAGTSIGAMFALFMVLKLGAQEVEQEIQDADMHSLLSMNIGMLLTRYGLDDGQRLEARINAVIRRFTRLTNPSMVELERFTGRAFTCVATDVCTNKAFYMSATTVPDMPVSKAVAISMAIPPVFCPTHYKDKVLVDGGFVDNFPMHLFPLHETLGLRVNWTCGFTMDSMDKYFGRVTYCALAASEEALLNKLTAEQKARVLVIEVGDISTFDLRLNDHQKRIIQDIGKTALRQSKLFVARGA